MPITVNPIDALSILLDRSGRKKDGIADYLDAIAKEAEIFVQVWERAFTSLSQGAFTFDELDMKLKSEIYFATNAGPFARLRMFYDDITPALGGRIAHDHKENIMSHLGGLLRHREITRAAYLKSLGSMENPFFLDGNNSVKDFSDLGKSLTALHNEAAALTILIEKMKLLLK